MRKHVLLVLLTLVLALGGNILSEQTKAAVSAETEKQGLIAHYYRDLTNWGGNWPDGETPKVKPEAWTFTKYAYSRREPLINHMFVRSGWFSVRWQGYLNTAGGRKREKTAEYTFHIWADDGCRLIIDGKTVIDSWQPAWEEDEQSHRYGTITLTPGKHRIVVEYFQGESLRKMDRDPIRLYWKCKARKMKDKIIPAACFSHTVDDLVAKPGRTDKAAKTK